MRRNVAPLPTLAAPILLCLAVCCDAIGQAADVVTTPALLAGGQGCYLSGDGAGLWSSLLRVHQGAVLYVEAESGHKLTMQKGRDTIPDPACGGGMCIAHVTHAEFVLDAPRAGTYQGWARSFLPRAGSWNHRESMDDGEPRQIQDSAARVFGRWVWTKLGDYRLSAGRHTFVLHNWLGGAKLDALIFSGLPDFSPEGLRGAPPIDPADPSGTVTSAVLRPSCVGKLHRLETDAALNGGVIAADVSTDGGRTWSRALAGGDLGQVRTAADGSDELVLRFRLAAAPDGASPLLRGATLTYDVPRAAEVGIENRHYRIVFDRRTGALCGIGRRQPELPVTAPHLREPLLGLAVREPDATSQTLVPPAEISLTGLTANPSRVALTYEALGGDVSLTVEVAADESPLSSWTCTVRNRGPREVIRVDFPLIGGAAIGDWRDDECVLPKTGGQRLRRPAEGNPSEVTYLGSASMSWLDLCDARAGLYVAMQDRRLTTTAIGCAPAAGNRSVDLSFRTHTLVRPGEQTTRRFVVGVHRGDWHWAADRYREWAQSWMSRPDNPDWVTWCDGWVAASGAPFARMTSRLAQGKGQGINYLQYWGHMADGIDQCCGNFYWPAPALGGAEGFRRGIADVHADGGRVTAYMNCQTWTRDSPINDSLRRTPKSALPEEALRLIHPLSWFEQWRLRPLDGKPLGYYAATYGWYIMCPASRGFSEHLRFWIVDMYAKRFGADGVYIDQTGATHAKPCYNLEHGHDDIGHWGLGNVKLLESSLAQARARNPEFVIAIEGAGDALGQFAGLHLISGLCSAPEVYHYTFPDHILISGFSNSSPLTTDQRVARAFLNGDRFDSRVGRTEAGAALRLRRRVKRWLYPGRFMDTLGLTVSDPAVRARWTRCEDGGEKAIVYTFDNEQRRGGVSCMLDLPEGWEAPRSLFLFTSGGRVTAKRPVCADGRVSFAVPKSRLSAGLLVSSMSARGSVDAWCDVRNVQGDRGDLVITAVNLGTVSADVGLTARCNPPLAGGAGEIRMSVPPGGTAEARHAVRGIAGLVMPTLVTVHVSWEGGSTTSWTEVEPLLINPGLDHDADGDGTPDCWSPGGTKATFRRGVEEGAAWIQGEKKAYAYLIQHIPAKPNTAYTFSGRVKRSQPTADVSVAVVEFVGARGLRVHRIGGDADAPAGEWRRYETTFTTGPEFRDCAVYLYNTHTTVKGWYDDLELMEAE